MKCAECRKGVSQISDTVWYCKECDRIIISKDELIEEKQLKRR